MFRRKNRGWQVIEGQPLTELDKKILHYQNKGHLVPDRSLINTKKRSNQYGCARFGRERNKAGDVH